MRCSLLLHSSLTPLPGQWDRRQSCKYTLGATFVIISQNFLIARHKSFGCATIARHNIKHVLWRAIAARVAFYSRPGLCWQPSIFSILKYLNTIHLFHIVLLYLITFQTHIWNAILTSHYFLCTQCAIFSLSDSLFISSTPNTSMVFRVFPWSVRNIAGLYFFSISVSTIYLILIPISNVIGGSLSCLLLCKNRLYYKS